MAKLIVPPPTYRLPPIPAPPVTISAPVVVLVLTTLLLIVNALVIVPPLKPPGSAPTDVHVNVPAPLVLRTYPVIPPLI